MPELPEVETYRSYLAHRALHKRIIEMEADFESYGRIFEASRSELASLEEESFEKALRHGKYCLLEATNERVLVLHFGMTGGVKYYNYREEASDPEHSAMVFTFFDDHKLAITSVRKFGKVIFAESRGEFIERQGLGPDALSLDREGFVGIMRAKRGGIKSALMDQRTIAGIGNIYSDEILYHAGIRPDEKLNDLSEEDLETLYEKMIFVLNTAVENDADSGKMPENYLIRRRGEGALCGICGGKIKNVKIGGRSAYFCPRHQK